MNNNNKENEKGLMYSLKEIANWTNKTSEVEIPALQRGLVWKPAQVELLWDSILRGFPIGSFLLSDVIDKNKNCKYYLMDGQQRFNAISLGYNIVEKSRAFLWLDLNPSSNENSTRVFWIKATTISHPWGFHNNDECGILNTSEKREAIKNFGLSGTIYNTEISLRDTWPIKADAPIPLYCLLNASTENEETFYFEVKNNLNKLKKEFALKKVVSIEAYKGYITNHLYKVFNVLKEYKVSCNHLTSNIIEKETSNDNASNQTTLEVLFTRLNTGGTTISHDDLNYSAIKAYWPDIKDENDRLAEEYMNPSKLAMLVFRLALTEESDNNFNNDLSIKQIRSISKDEKKHNKIMNLYNKENNSESNLEWILKKVDRWLGVCGDNELRTPSVLRTTISHKSPDIYLLLMYFAYQEFIGKEFFLSDKEIKALAFCLHWFALDKKKCANIIYKSCKEGINIDNIRKGLSQLMNEELMLNIYTPKEVESFIKIEKTENWVLWNHIPLPAKSFFVRVFSRSTVSEEMLLYAQRQYINKKFPKYDPAQQDMWEEHNRPWDFDHIIPKEWINGKRGSFREYDKIWLNSIGNLAAISFEYNRSKNNKDNYSGYEDNKESLMFNKCVKKICSEITYLEDQSYLFAKITLNRFLQIYKRIYEVVEVLFKENSLAEYLEERRKLMDALRKEISGEVFFVAENDDFSLNRKQDWTRPWIGVGKVIGEFMPCFEWTGQMEDNKPQNAEIGIRKAPGSLVTENNRERVKDKFQEYNVENNEWWYKYKEVKLIDKELIIGTLKSFIEELEATQ